MIALRPAVRRALPADGRELVAQFGLVVLDELIAAYFRREVVIVDGRWTVADPRP